MAVLLGRGDRFLLVFYFLGIAQLKKVPYICNRKKGITSVAQRGNTRGCFSEIAEVAQLVRAHDS